MKASIKEIIQSLETWAPPALQEDYDNSGLLCGDTSEPCTGILICLDSIETVVDEAIQQGCNLIVAHHPILFSKLRKLTGKNYVERTLLKAIRNNIAIYAIHTNLDHIHTGVNRKIGEKIGMQSMEILQPKSSLLLQLSVYVPNDFLEPVRQALFSAGAGKIGNYDQCSFTVNGTGTFRAGNEANPFVGEIGKLQQEAETKLEMVLPVWMKDKVMAALMKAHPYEEVAYNIMKLENTWNSIGAGMRGMLPEPMDTLKLLKHIQSVFGGAVRHTQIIKPQVQHLAWCGGSGAFLLSDAIRAGADVFITSDVKYHQFFDAEDKILLIDIGHFENEQFTIQLIHDYLNENFPNFATRVTSVSTNPIHYL